ncbi:motility associated factor glycosyltransferase family protein [Leadbettera azotonutricia]|nr:6-hydroxymethylpterin diphosphokinase MptE-like protein [Leadbettera azotonutricia]
MESRAFWESNIAIIREKYPGLAETLEAGPESGETPAGFHIENASSGIPTLVIGSLHVHSPRDPVREASRLAEAALTEGVRAPVIILGFGLGYAAEAAARIAPGRALIIVEKHKEVLRAALETRDLGELLSRNQIIFVLGKDGYGVSAALALFEKPGEKTAPDIIRNRALMNLDEDWYTGVEANIRTWLSKDDVNRATLKRFGKRWVRNLSRNLSAIRDIPGISHLAGMLGGGETGGMDIPAFLAAAGPTLDKTGPFLSEIAERCVVIAVDTSLRFLLSQGVEPDFVVSVDPQYWNFRHLDRVLSPNAYLVAESAVYPPCLRQNFKGAFLCGSLFPLGRFIEDRLDPKGSLGAGGSVATTAWDFARVLGASSIWIAGLDLSFPELKTHFKGALFETRAHAESTRFVPGETWSVRALRDGHPFNAKNSLGFPVLTDKRLSLYAAWFENRFRLYPKLRNLSLSGEGIAIKGLEISSVEDLLALPPRREEIKRRLESVLANLNNGFFSSESEKVRSSHYEGALKTLIEGLNSISTLAKDAANTAKTAFHRSRQGRLLPIDEERALKKLDDANKSLSTSKVKEVAGFLFPEIDELEAQRSPAALTPIQNHLEFSSRFYNALAEAAGYNLAILNK